jgi:pilus assembly protein CpaC
MKRVLQWTVLAMLASAGAAGAQTGERINLLLGEQRTLEVESVTRVAVGDGAVLNVRVLSPGELLLSGLSTGVTTLTTWNDRGERRTLTVQVYTQDPLELRGQVESLLRVDGTPIEGVRVRVVGDRVVVEGEVFKDADLKRVEEVARVYPALVNLTTFTRAFNVIKPMLQLDLHFFEMRRDDLTEVGIDWANIVDPIDRPLVELIYTEPLNAAPGVGGSGSINVFSDFNPLRLRGRYEGVRLLQHHKMVVRSGEKAHYLEGGTVYIIAQGATGAGQIRDVEFGFIVDVVPEVDRAGNVVMTIEQRFSVPNRAQLIAGFPTFEERAISTSVNLGLGQTVMLAGFLTEELTKASLGIPGFARLPVLGALFGAQASATVITDGVLFITPTLVQGVGSPGEDPFIRGLIDRYRSGSFRGGSSAAP